MTRSTKANGKQLKDPIRYEIHIKEPIDPHWVPWFQGMIISQVENGETVLSGPVLDKSALHGMIAMIGELNLTLVSVIQLESKDPSAGGNHE